MYSRKGVRQSDNHLTTSRIDMLLGIYDATIDSLVVVMETMKASDACHSARSHSIVLINLLESGLDLSKGDLPEKIKGLCVYAERGLLNSDLETIQAAHRAFSTIREGFREIREQAVDLERAGAIPKLPVNNSFDELV